ncbi:MAG: hypothetical protein C0617_07150 [Desulfuromonas sp.]|nr:MAG: hypothetical protein C0617_07150 [Desulfuromonas sp.]
MPMEKKNFSGQGLARCSRPFERHHGKHAGTWMGAESDDAQFCCGDRLIRLLPENPLELFQSARVDFLGIQRMMFKAENLAGLVCNGGPSSLVGRRCGRGMDCLGEKKIKAPQSHIGLFFLPVFAALLQVGKEEFLLLLGDSGGRRDRKKRIAFSNLSDIMRNVFFMKRSVGGQLLLEALEQNSPPFLC